MGLHREMRRLRRLGIVGFIGRQVRHVRYSVGPKLLLQNWREVRATYRASNPPPLRFRRGFTLAYTPADVPLTLMREIFIDRCYRRNLREPERGVMLDIGANIGLASLDWATRLPDVVIHAYEPDPATFATLARNIELNRLGSRVRLYNEAVGDRSGTLELRRIGHSAQTTAHSAKSQSEDCEVLSAPMVGLQEVVDRARRDGPISLAKIDVEGFEAAILEGAPAATLAAVPQIIVEYHDSISAGARRRCEAALSRAGFRCLARPSSFDRVADSTGLLYATARA